MMSTEGARETQGPLVGKRVLVTRAQKQASSLSSLLVAAGAIPLEAPTIRIQPADDYAALDAALRAAGRYDWLVATSVNTVAYLAERMRALHLSWSVLAPLSIAAIGPKTAATLQAYGLTVSHMPADYLSSAIAAELPLMPGHRILLPRADIADKRLVDGLRERGAIVDEYVAYRTMLPGQEQRSRLQTLLADSGVDAATFTSASTVRNLWRILGDDAAALLSGVVLACIGPITADTVRSLGLEPHVVAHDYTIDGLVAALAAYYHKLGTRQ